MANLVILREHAAGATIGRCGPWQHPEPALDREIVSGIILMLMQLDAKLDQVRQRLVIDDEKEEDDA